jgi:hypothetical protein
MTGSKISTGEERIIIKDFAKVITNKKIDGNVPEDTVIEFRNDRQNRRTRKIWLVPTNILRFRKDNGRIASDVMSYEMINGRLDETLEETQEILRNFLKEKDEEKNITLKKTILHSGQIEPAIITCDGFLINGNRRKMVIEELFNDPKISDKKSFETMKVIILPGHDDKGEGGPPTIKEIEQIENRYQMQSDGKAEYTNFDRAISIKRKIRAGMTLEEQLRDDPNYIGMSEKEFRKELQKYQDEFLGPLECVDNYLEQLDRKGLYDNISESRKDREGRWYSFIDYYKSVYKPLQDEKTRMNAFGVEEDEVGEIEDVAFKIIRRKDFPHIKTHEVIRKFSKILKDKNAKKEIMKIKNVPHEIDKNDFNEDDDFKTIDKRWGKKHETMLVGRVMESIRTMEHTIELETPIVLLKDALKKLNHENMNPDGMNVLSSGEAWEKCKEIQERAHELEKIFWEKKESLKKLKNKKW